MFSAAGKTIEFPASCGPTSRAPTTPRPTWRTRRCGCRPWRRATPSTRSPSSPRTTPRRRPPASPRRRWSRRWRSWASAARPPTRRSSATIQDRGYVWKKGTALVPSLTAFAVVSLLERPLPRPGRLRLHRPHGGRPRQHRHRRPRSGCRGCPASTSGTPTRRENGRTGLKAMVNDRLDEIDPREVNAIPLGKDADGREIAVRVGKYGPYLSRGATGRRRRYPTGSPPTSSPSRRPRSCWPSPAATAVLGTDPDSGLPVTVREGRYGPYVQLGDADATAKAEAPHRVAVQADVARHAHPRRGPPAADHPPGAGRRSRPTARRSAPRTAATGRT